MPWTPADAPRYDKDADSPKKRRQWSKVANSTLKRLKGQGVAAKDAEGRAIRAASSTVESASTGTFYRDSDYGALGLILGEGGIEVYDHNFLHAEAVLAVLKVQATKVDETNWHPRVHQDIILANIDRVLRDAGYTEEALGDSVVAYGVPAADIRKPDLPAAGHVHVSEAVERVISAQLNTALGSLGLAAMVETAIFEPFPRPNAGAGRTLPFFRVQATIKARDVVEGLDLADVCKRWRAALAPMAEALVRATVGIDTTTGNLVLEAGIRPPETVLLAFEAAVLPAFEQHPIMGDREVHIHIKTPLAEDDLAKLRERALACTAATSLEMVEGEPVLHARVPSMMEGDHLADPAFRERVTWLVQETEAWDCSLEWVGQMREAKVPQKRQGKETVAKGPGTEDGKTGPKKRHGKQTVAG